MKMPLYLRVATALTVLAAGYCLWDDFVRSPEDLAGPAGAARQPRQASSDRTLRPAAPHKHPASAPEIDLFPDQRIVQAPAPVEPPVERAPLPRPPPALPFQISGVWVEGPHRKILVNDGNKNIIVCRQCDDTTLLTEGDLLNTHYRIEKIDTHHITLTYLPLQIKQVIRLDKAMAETGT